MNHKPLPQLIPEASEHHLDTGMHNLVPQSHLKSDLARKLRTPLLLWYRDQTFPLHMECTDQPSWSRAATDIQDYRDHKPLSRLWPCNGPAGTVDIGLLDARRGRIDPVHTQCSRPPTLSLQTKTIQLGKECILFLLS